MQTKMCCSTKVVMVKCIGRRWKNSQTIVSTDSLTHSGQFGWTVRTIGVQISQNNSRRNDGEMTMKNHKLKVDDIYEGDDRFTVWLPCTRKTLPTDLCIDDGKYKWDCHLTKSALKKVGGKNGTEMYRCTYKMY
jgi:hypothetical protein